MGYTTRFTGAFTFDKPLASEHMLILRGLAGLGPGDHGVPDDAPDAYLQWEPTRDGTGLQWDGGEKFYEYEEWLQYLIDHYFTPWGYALSGSVKYAGESSDDRGVLAIVDGKVQKMAPDVTEWAKVAQRDREWVRKRLVSCMSDGNEAQRDAAAAAIAALGLKLGR